MILLAGNTGGCTSTSHYNIIIKIINLNGSTNSNKHNNINNNKYNDHNHNDYGNDN